jgi:hypothetical protein
MSDSRKILINESFLSSSNISKKNKKESKSKTKKTKPKSVIKPNSLKKTLLEKIKKHQLQEKITSDNSLRDKNNEEGDNNNEFHNNFMNSLEYLNKLNKKSKNDKQNRKKHNKSLEKKSSIGGNNVSIPPIQNPSEPLVSVDLPMDFDSPNNNIINPIIHTSRLNENPLYGGNNINSFSQPHSIVQQPVPIVQQHVPTVQEPVPIVQQPVPIVQQPVPIVQQPVPIVQQHVINKTDTPYGCLKGGKKPTYRVYHNKTLKNKPITIKYPSNNNNNSQHNERKQKLADLKKSYKKIRQKKRVTRKSTFNLGKIGGKVSVLIKNNATRRKVKREHGLLKQKSITEIKKHLYDKNLLKIGSTAPNDVLRTLYEQSILAGDVTNTSNEVQIHNFMNK